MRFLVSSFLLCFITVACSLRYTRVAKLDDVEKYLDQIQSYNHQIYQLKASLDIRAFGVMKSFIHEQADVVVKDPKYLLFSLRSFFGPPASLIASNGDFITVLDYSGGRSSAYQKIPIRPGSSFELFEFSFHPPQVIKLLLAKIPLYDRKSARLSVLDDKLKIETQLENGWQAQSIFDLSLNQLLEIQLEHQALSVSYHAKYDNFQKTSGIYFPRSLVLFAKQKSRFARFHIEIKGIELNGEPVLSDVFYLRPH